MTVGDAPNDDKGEKDLPNPLNLPDHDFMIGTQKGIYSVVATSIMHAALLVLIDHPDENVSWYLDLGKK